MRPFNVLSLGCPIFGSHLLEASAGTGKTFAIEHAFVRILLETEDLEVEQILVVTFTRSATRDLKSRIRANLEEAKHRIALQNDEWEYLVPYLGVKKAEQRLADSLVAFDRCQIFTIHSFCHRMLQEFAFEANLCFTLPDPDQKQELPIRLLRRARHFLENEVDLDLICPEQMSYLLKHFDSLTELAEALLTGDRHISVATFSVLKARYFAIPLDEVDESKLLEDFQKIALGYKVKKGRLIEQVSALSKRDVSS